MFMGEHSGRDAGSATTTKMAANEQQERRYTLQAKQR
jgi:hypothetical protein